MIHSLLIQENSAIILIKLPYSIYIFCFLTTSSNQRFDRQAKIKRNQTLSVVVVPMDWRKYVASALLLVMQHVACHNVIWHFIYEFTHTGYPWMEPFKCQTVFRSSTKAFHFDIGLTMRLLSTMWGKLSSFYDKRELVGSWSAFFDSLPQYYYYSYALSFPSKKSLLENNLKLINSLNKCFL